MVPLKMRCAAADEFKAREHKKCAVRRRRDGEGTRTRTWDLLVKSQLLYQLSYAPDERTRSTK